MPCLGPAVTAVALCEDAFDQADGFLSFDLPAAGGCLTRVAGVLPERLRAHSGDQHVERAPCVTEVPVMIFRRRMDLEPSGMVRDACCNAYELASKTLAVGASVCLVMSGQRLEPRRDVESEQCGPHPHHVHRLVAGWHVAHGETQFRIFDFLLDEGAHAEPRFDVDNRTSDVGDDEAVRIRVESLARREEAELVRVDGAAPAAAWIGGELGSCHLHPSAEGARPFRPSLHPCPWLFASPHQGSFAPRATPRRFA